MHAKLEQLSFKEVILRKLITCLMVVGLGTMALAGPFVGVEIVPTGGSPVAGKTNLAIGWDSGSWIKTTVSFSNPFYLNGSYGVSVSPLWSITPSWRIGGEARLGVALNNLRFTDACWSVGIETDVKWRGVLGWLIISFPLEISGNKPLSGALITFGVAYDLFPCCIAEEPGCPENILGSGCP